MKVGRMFVRNSNLVFIVGRLRAVFRMPSEATVFVIQELAAAGGTVEGVSPVLRRPSQLWEGLFDCP